MTDTTAAAILVVDDETDLREAVAEFLSRRGFAVRQAAEAAAARRLLADSPADAVILDITMPGEDGLTLARALRADSDMGILMLTGAADVVDRVLGLELGADDYLAKPVDLRELLARLRAVLRRREAATLRAAAPPAPPPQLRIGRHRLDIAARRLTSAEGAEIPLGPGEYALLKAMAERPGRVLSREQLLELAHPRGEELFDRAIDVCVARLRRKIELVPERPAIIRTVRGAGYVFDPLADG